MSAPQIFQTPCLVLRDHPGEPAVAGYATARGWSRVQDVSQVAAERARAVAWAIEPGLTVHYAEDDTAPVSYVFVRSRAPGVATATLGVLRQALHPWSLEELIDLIDRAEDTTQRMRALTRLVIAAPHHATAEVLRRLRAALDDDSCEVRRAGISGMLHLLWPECRPLLESAAEWDSDRQLRKYAKAVMRDFDRIGVSQR